MCAFPTGWGKSLPALLLGLFLPQGSTVILVVPLHNIEVQLMQDCQKYGISALAGCQTPPKDLERAMSSRPKLLICNVEYLADSQVRQTLMKSRLSPPGQRPIVCIDEAQVRVFLLSSSII